MRADVAVIASASFDRPGEDAKSNGGSDISPTAVNGGLPIDLWVVRDKHVGDSRTGKEAARSSHAPRLISSFLVLCRPHASAVAEATKT